MIGKHVSVVLYLRTIKTNFSSGKVSFEEVSLQHGSWRKESAYRLIGTTHAMVQREEATTGRHIR